SHPCREARMRKSHAAVLAMSVTLLAIGIASSQTRPAPPPAVEVAAPGRPGWSVDVRSGCWVWNIAPQHAETVTWSGSCGLDGLATGRGVSEWRWEQNGERKVQRYEGEYRGGKRSGRGVVTFVDGARYQGEFRDDNYNGRGVVMYANGDGHEGECANGRRDGRG